MEKVTLSMRELKKLEVVKRSFAGEMTVVEAGRVLGLSVRQVYRLRRSFKRKGVKGIVHGNRGKESSRRASKEVRERVIKLAREKYVGFNDTHMWEHLYESEGIELSRETVRKILRSAGIGAVRRRRAPKHRKRRERREREGMMVILDASPHDWLEGRGPRMTLLGVQDDATGRYMTAVFRREEDSAGYLFLLRDMLKRYGIPYSVYTDHHGIFENRREATIAEQLEGEEPLTQFGRALKELDIEPIFADSPQAKGRIERSWGTFQDRLISELRLAKASNIEEAEVVLKKFIGDYNRRFSVKARDAVKAWRVLPEVIDLDRICCFKYEGTVLNDNTVRIGKTILDIPPGPNRMSYAKAKVEICWLLDGSFRIYYKDEMILKTKPLILVSEQRALCRRPAKARRYYSSVNLPNVTEGQWYHDPLESKVIHQKHVWMDNKWVDINYKQDKSVTLKLNLNPA